MQSIKQEIEAINKQTKIIQSINQQTKEGKATMKNSIFTKKHYEAIAKVLKEARKHRLHGTQHCQITIFNIQTLIANLFEEDNANFNKQKFEEAITKEEEQEAEQSLLSIEEAEQLWQEQNEYTKELHFWEEAKNNNI